MVWLFTITIFTGAALLLLVQPLFTRMVLPMLGGSPAVWNTSLVFYQAALLAGYAYAHFLTKRFRPRHQLILHTFVLLISLLLLPIAIPRAWSPATDTNPIPSLLLLMTLSVGLPFFALSATSPLLQKWFASGNPQRDPYFLYSASNLGSLLALAAYPILIEPHLGLHQQSHWWSIAFCFLLVLMFVCGWQMTRTVPSPSSDIPASQSPLTPRRRWRWLLLALAPCSLMLSVTTYITNEVAPVPLLWMLPLGIYLLSFVLVFSRRQRLSHRVMVRLFSFAVLSLPWTMIGLLRGQPSHALDWMIALHLAVLFIVAMVCHGELAADRPPASQLTEFYLWLSTGGVLGGIFNALIAPRLFPTVMEYPLTLILACALLPASTKNSRPRLGDFFGPILLGVSAATLGFLLPNHRLPYSWLSPVLMFALPSVLCLLFVRKPHRFTAGVAALFIAFVLPGWFQAPPLHLARSFFGIHEVFAIGPFHFLKHGCTIHSVENMDPARHRDPLAYYSRSGPLGQIFATLPESSRQEIAVVGLGAGVTACYGEPGAHWTYFEIDPLVERIARDPRYFTFLADCPAKVDVVLGDARLSLQKAADNRFDLLILDAYNSDTLPLHLLTREALALYRQKLRPNGVLAFHISARHLDLKPVLANLAHKAGLTALYESNAASPQELARGESSSRWIVMTADSNFANALIQAGYWRHPKPDRAVGVWTDDYASLFTVWSWF